jgi:uncharacterized membrane protein
MQNIPQETQDAFKKENGMTFEEAIEHVQQWIKEGNTDSAHAGIDEMKKFTPDLQELQDLETKLRSKKSTEVQEKADKKEEATVDTSNLEEVTKEEKFLSAIGYFGFLCVLPLALKQNSEFCKYHGKQALMLALVFTVLSAVSVILPGGFGLLSIAHIVISFYGFMQANKGKLWNMPALGEAGRKLPF